MKRYSTGITFGTADPLHAGHLALIGRARDMVDTLVVCIATDESIRKRKGREPFFPLEQRLYHLSQVRDIIIGVREHDGYMACVERYGAEVVFVSEEYRDKTDWQGAKLGIPVIYLPYTEGVSSTMLRL